MIFISTTTFQMSTIFLLRTMNSLVSMEHLFLWISQDLVNYKTGHKWTVVMLLTIKVTRKKMSSESEKKYQGREKMTSLHLEKQNDILQHDRFIQNV